MIALSWAQLSRAADETPNGSPRIFGIMVTRSDYWVMHTWLATHAWQFEKLVILDGTSESHSQFVEAAASMYDNVIYVNEKDVELPERITDNSLRGVAWSLLPNHEDMIGSWVVVAHPDEFFIVPFACISMTPLISGGVTPMPSPVHSTFHMSKRPPGGVGTFITSFTTLTVMRCPVMALLCTPVGQL